MNALAAIKLVSISAERGAGLVNLYQLQISFFGDAVKVAVYGKQYLPIAQAELGNDAVDG